MGTSIKDIVAALDTPTCALLRASMSIDNVLPSRERYALPTNVDGVRLYVRSVAERVGDALQGGKDAVSRRLRREMPLRDYLRHVLDHDRAFAECHPDLVSLVRLDENAWRDFKDAGGGTR